MGLAALFTEVLETVTSGKQLNSRLFLVSRKDGKEHYLAVLRQQQNRNDAFHGTEMI